MTTEREYRIENKVRKFVVNNEDYRENHEYPADEEDIVIEEYFDWKRSVIDTMNIGGWILKYVDFATMLLDEDTTELVIYNRDDDTCYDFFEFCDEDHKRNISQYEPYTLFVVRI